MSDGFDISNNIISGKVDDVTMTFSDTGDFIVKDGGITLDKLAESLLLAIYPIGSIYTNAEVSTDPSTLLGFGDWEAFGAGRVQVGIDVGGDADFDTLNEEAGAKTHELTEAEMPEHTHEYTKPISAGTRDSGAFSNLGTESNTTGTTGSGDAHNNLQPYIVVHMWKRIA